jgi:predicted XRE-type DNA-binding protein
LEKIEFQSLLKTAQLKKKDLANILGIGQSSINNWGSSKDIPYWVETWLGNFIKAKKFDEAKKLLCKK